MAKIVSGNKYFDASERSWQGAVASWQLPVTSYRLPETRSPERPISFLQAAHEALEPGTGNRKWQTINRILQTFILLVIPYLVSSQYKLQIKPVDKDSAFIHSKLRLQTDFKNEIQARDYVQNLPVLLQAKGYPTASIDTVIFNPLGAACSLYIGETYQWANLHVDSADRKLLDAVNLNLRNSKKQALSFDQVLAAQQKLLDYLENNGYPFAKIKLDSITLVNQQLEAYLRINRGPLYTIDSIRNFGTANIYSTF